MKVFEEMNEYNETQRSVTYQNVSLDFLKELIDEYFNPKKSNEMISKIEFGRTDLGYPIVEVEYIIY